MEIYVAETRVRVELDSVVMFTAILEHVQSYTECHSIIKRFEFGIHDVHSLYMYQICGPLYTVQEVKRYRTSSKDPKSA